MSCYHNPASADLEKGNYKPRLTLIRRNQQGGFSIKLKIEFSAPKLIFGNNFEELEGKDFCRVIDNLYEKLLDIGILTRREVLRRADISAIHYSKNIVLENGLTSSMLIRELGKIDLNRRLDLSHTDFRNEGHSIRYHANSYEVTFYDKIKDLQKAKISEKRAIEKDNAIQFGLFENRLGSQMEVLRMEVRLGNRNKLKSLFKKLGLDSGLTFQELFDSNLSRKILLHFWEEIRLGLNFLSTSSSKPEDLYLQIKAGNPKMKSSKLLQYTAVLQLANSVGIRGLRALLEVRLRVERGSG